MSKASQHECQSRVSKITTPVRSVAASALWRIGFEADRLSSRISGIEPLDPDGLESYAGAVGHALQAMREGADLSLEQMAELLYIDAGELARIERGRRDLAVEHRFPVVLARHLRGVTA